MSPEECAGVVVDVQEADLPVVALENHDEGVRELIHLQSKQPPVYLYPMLVLAHAHAFAFLKRGAPWTGSGRRERWLGGRKQARK